jgi:hypothetical protein
MRPVGRCSDSPTQDSACIGASSDSDNIGVCRLRNVPKLFKGARLELFLVVDDDHGILVEVTRLE